MPTFTGFGQGLKETTMECTLARKVSFENLQNFGELCFSTLENSVELIGTGELCIVLKKAVRTGMYYDGDADAGKNFGYDEFRVYFDSFEEIVEEIEYVVIPDYWEEDIEEENYDNPEKDPEVWKDSINTLLNTSDICISESRANLQTRINF